MEVEFADGIYAYVIKKKWNSNLMKAYIKIINIFRLQSLNELSYGYYRIMDSSLKRLRLYEPLWPTFFTNGQDS